MSFFKSIGKTLGNVGKAVAKGATAVSKVVPLGSLAAKALNFIPVVGPIASTLVSTLPIGKMAQKAKEIGHVDLQKVEETIIKSNLIPSADNIKTATQLITQAVAVKDALPVAKIADAVVNSNGTIDQSKLVDTIAKSELPVTPAILQAVTNTVADHIISDDSNPIKKNERIEG